MASGVIAKSNKETTTTITSSYLAKPISVRKIGDVCSINIDGLKNVQNNTNTILGTLPSGFRPLTQESFDVSLWTGSSVESYRVMVIPEGVIYLYAYNGVTTQANFVRSIMFFAH